MQKRIIQYLLGTAILATLFSTLLVLAVCFILGFDMIQSRALWWMLVIEGSLLLIGIPLCCFMGSRLAQRYQQADLIENARMRQEFTANVSHELKTPLTAISGYSELIEKGMVSTESEVRRFAGEIRRNSNRLLTLINDVIRLSELDDGETQEILEPTDLDEVAKACVSMLQLDAEKHHVTLLYLGERTMIQATKQMAEEILFNLCDNAIRYNIENGTVYVHTRLEGDRVILSVKDNGIGISKANQNRVFERFYRVDKSRSKQTGGTGLGLAIVKHIVLLLQGEIHMESEEEKGTEITISFPACQN